MNRIWIFPTLFLFYLSFGCSKHNTGPSQNPTVPSIPVTEMVSPQIIGVVNTPSGGAFSNMAVYFSGANWNCDGTLFYADTGTTDKYFTRLILNSPSGVEANKTIAISAPGLNYVRIKPISMQNFGTLQNGKGGTFGNEASGTVTLPPNAIATTGDIFGPGYYGPDIRTDISIGYLSPLSSDFGLSNPGFPVGDVDGERYFLNSAGIMDYSLGYANWITDKPGYAFYSTYTGTLTMPIATGLPAPDSIPFWRLTAGKWVKSGMAHKSGTNYTAVVHEYGAFNFAQPLKGAYTTLRVRTVNNSPLINACLRIKANNIILFEGQTDWEGNALVFLPTGISANIEIFYPLAPVSTIPAGQISNFSSTATLDISVSGPLQIYTLSGKVNNCDGSPVKRGKVVVYNPLFKELWHLPVVNGTFNAAILDGSYEKMIYTLKAVNSDANVTGTDTAVSIMPGPASTYVLNTCPAVSSLFMRYAVDGVWQTITGDRSDPHNPYLVAFQSQEQTLITTDSQEKGLQFSTYAFSPGVYIGSGIYTLYVDGKGYNYEPGKPMRVTFDRYDLLPGGLVAGSADFYYSDSLGVLHHVECSFQLVRE